MTLQEAMSTIRGIPEMRKAIIIVLDEAIHDLEKRLLTSSANDEKAIIRARQALDGALTMRASLVKLLGTPVKPVSAE